MAGRGTVGILRIVPPSASHVAAVETRGNVMIGMKRFYAKAGELLLTVHHTVGEAPRRAFVVEFQYERGWAKYDGREWTRHIYAPEEQQRIDRERATV